MLNIDIFLISSSFNQQKYFQRDAVIDADESRIIIPVTGNLCQWYGSCELVFMTPARACERVAISPVCLAHTRGAGEEGGKMATNYSTATAVEPRALTALFKNREDADSAYEWLLKNGYNSDDIHLLMSEEMRQKYHYAEATQPETTEDDAVVGLEAGAAFGGGLGAALGVVAGVGAAVIIPGLGLAVAGPLAATLAGAGGLVGGALGALYGSSIPEQQARELEKKIREGSILISVRPPSDEDAELIESEWRERGGEMVYY